MELKYNINKPWETLDPWQKDYITAEGNCFLLCGRQSGKSVGMSIKAAELAVKKKNQDIMIVAYTEKQAYELFLKVLNYLEACYREYLCTGVKKPTKHEIKLENGSIIRCHACGQTGSGLRGYSLTKIFIDEAAPMNSEIFAAIVPALSVTKGSMDLASTPRGKEGFFYECSLRDDFTKFYVSAEDCPRHDKKFLEIEKKTKSELEYCQEYLAIFTDQITRLFTDALIKKCCVLKRSEIIRKDNTYLGTDIARMGMDLSTFQIIRKVNEDYCEQVESLSTSKQLITQTADKIIDLNRIFDFKAIGVDGSGVGGGCFDILMKEESTRRKTASLDNATKPLDREGKKRKRILKEDMYMTLLSYMEKGKIRLIDDDDLVLSLKSIQYEYIIKEGRQSAFRIFSSYGHHVEGLIRAVWLISQDKTLNIWIKSI